MPMSETVAQQVADLLNSQNQLTIHYTGAEVLAHQKRYIVRIRNESEVLGAVEVKEVQWYQCEIDHLTVAPRAKRQGVGTGLLEEAEARGRQLGARIAQCTIRVGNVESEALFIKRGYTRGVTFVNEGNDNRVTVYQKVL